MILNVLLSIALLPVLVVGERLSSLMYAVPLPVHEGVTAHLGICTHIEREMRSEIDINRVDSLSRAGRASPLK